MALDGIGSKGTALVAGRVDPSYAYLLQPLPRDVSLTAFAVRATIQSPASVSGSVTIRANLYTLADDRSLVRIPESECVLGPALTGTVTTGTTVSCEATGLPVQLPAGSAPFVLLMPTATGNDSSSNSLSVQVTVSSTLE